MAGIYYLKGFGKYNPTRTARNSGGLSLALSIVTLTFKARSDSPGHKFLYELIKNIFGSLTNNSCTIFHSLITRWVASTYSDLEWTKQVIFRVDQTGDIRNIRSMLQHLHVQFRTAQSGKWRRYETPISDFQAAVCLLPYLQYRRRFRYEDDCSDHVILISNYPNLTHCNPEILYLVHSV